MRMSIQNILTIAGLMAMTMLAGCGNTLDRLENVGNAPTMENVQDPTKAPGYKPVSWPMPAPEAEEARGANSLWQPGSKSFFKDQRARRVGDILTVSVNINDLAQLDNKTDRQRQTDDSLGMPAFLGFQKQVSNLLPTNGVDMSAATSITGKTITNGTGKIDRKEKITTKVAAIVTQVLPNGNMVISGKQQVRVNYESREVNIDGVIRPEDLKSDNTIDLAQVAEARVSYGGRGQLSDIQQPRLGTQLLDIISPF